MPSLNASIRLSSFPVVGGPDRKGRGSRGKDPTNALRDSKGISGCRSSYRCIMVSATRAKEPAPSEMPASRQSRQMFWVAGVERVAETVSVFSGGRLS